MRLHDETVGGSSSLFDAQGSQHERQCQCTVLALAGRSQALLLRQRTLHWPPVRARRRCAAESHGHDICTPRTLADSDLACTAGLGFSGFGLGKRQYHPSLTDLGSHGPSRNGRPTVTPGLSSRL